MQLLDGQRAAGQVALEKDHRTPNQTGLGRVSAEHRRKLSRRVAHHASHGQLEHAPPGFAVRGVYPGKDQVAVEPVRVRLHTETRQLVKHGRN